MKSFSPAILVLRKAYLASAPVDGPLAFGKLLQQVSMGREWPSKRLDIVTVVEIALRRSYITFMPLTLDEIVEQTRQLPADVVADLVERILIVRHGGIESVVEAAWKTELDRRVQEIETGKVQGIPIEEALTRIRKIINE